MAEQFEEQWAELRRAILAEAASDGLDLAAREAILADAKPFLKRIAEGAPPLWAILALCERHYRLCVARVVEAERQSADAVKH